MTTIYFTGVFSDPELTKLTDHWNIDDDAGCASDVFSHFPEDLRYMDGYVSHELVDNVFIVQFKDKPTQYFALCEVEIDMSKYQVIRA